MIFIALTFLAALLIEGLGTLVSVIGLSKLFGANLIIIALAVALDLGKIVVVSLLYTYWAKLGKIMKTYALLAGFVTMVITSAGAFGYLSGEFQTAVIGTQEGSLKVDVLKQEQAKLEARKQQIDASIAAIPDRYTARQKIQLIAQFKDEQKQVTARLGDIDKQLPDLQIKQIGVEAKAGPILYVSKAFNVSIEVAVKYVILLIIFVFDPLAIFLIIAGNFLLHQRKLHKETGVADADLFQDDDDIRTMPLKKCDVQPDADAPTGSPEWNAAMDAIGRRERHEQMYKNLQVKAMMQDLNHPGWDHPALQPQSPVLPEVDLGYETEEEHHSRELERLDSEQPGWERYPTLDLTEADMGDSVFPLEHPEEKHPIGLPVRGELAPPHDPVPEDILIDGTEVMVEQPVPSQVVSLYIGESTPIQQIEEPTAPREEITLSTLGLVKPDPATITDVMAVPTNGDDFEVGQGTGVFKTGAPRR